MKKNPAHSPPFESAWAFFAVMPFLASCSVAYFFIVARSVMYFVGIYSYISTMVADLAAALNALDKRGLYTRVRR